MLTIEEQVENLSRAFYELDGVKWAEATEFVRQAVRTHVAVGMAMDPELDVEAEMPTKSPCAGAEGV